MLTDTPQMLQRERITSAILRALETCPLVMLHAPVGYGKSTAARNVAYQTLWPVAHAAVERGEENGQQVWSALTEQFQKRGKETRGPWPSLPADVSQLPELVDFCRDYFCDFPTLVVIENYQNINAPMVDALIERLAREELRGLRLLVCSRARPLFPLEELQLKRHAIVFDQEFLRFTPEEVEALFRVAGIFDQEAARSAWEQSAGWTAALAVIVREYLLKGVLRPYGSLEQLIEEIFLSYEESDQKLLLQLAVLETFTPEQAARVCADPTVPERLRALHQQNAFLALTSEEDTYSLHSLFQTVLSNWLSQKTLPLCRDLDERELFRRAGECCVAAKNRFKAVTLFAQAGRDEDLLRILQLFEEPDEGLFLVADPGRFVAIMKAIPWSVKVRCPLGYLGFIHRYMVRVDREQGVRLLEEAVARFKDEPFSPEECETLQGEMELLFAVSRFNDFEAMTQCYRNAHDLLQGPSILVNEQMFWTFSCPHSGFLYLREPGAYKKLLRTAKNGLPYFRSVSRGSNMGAEELLTAEYFLEIGSLQRAHVFLTRAEARILGSGQYAAILAAGFTRARLLLALGKADEARRDLDRVEAALGAANNDLLMNVFALSRSYIASVCGRPDEFPDRLFRQDAEHAPGFFSAEAFTLIVRGKTLMARQEWRELEILAEEADVRLHPLNLVFGRIHILVFKAIAAMHTHTRSTSVAGQYFDRARKLARQDGILTTFAEYGKFLYPLLQRLHKFDPQSRELGVLSRQTKKYARLTQDKASVLTLRERDILEKALCGASNREIGRELGLAPGSVGNALTRIYSKLGAANRVEAARKWLDERDPE